MTKRKQGNKNTPRSKNELARDRALVAELHYRGRSDREIVSELNAREDVPYTLSLWTIQNDRKAMRQQFAEQQMELTKIAIEEQELRIRMVEREAWLAWEESKKPVEEKREIQKLREYIEGAGNDLEKVEKMVVDTIETFTHSGVGDRGYLEILLKCIGERSRLRSLNTQNVKIDMNKKEEVSIKTYHVISPAMWNDPNISITDGEIIYDGEVIEPKQLLDGDKKLHRDGKDNGEVGEAEV